ncbi:efflux RND transporter periplasmic adaptor subunit [Aliihoeflea aestuarii]|jgi:membrane fusion protein, multidrug efflux system|uniref:efflux RND transporter periplasmic adaptor subunit n=1 Tax=Aliihoeflea aestuarii TaxID=453840 RepID=UPI0020927FAE|nr:efflux RND transporter periplasmic adaptor subunit [Aliihoeflea aestuarii]MCO6390185.1 efflux RND transporter periplasmic adaptor subunit [Aliihoeflea aestuarii]
MIKRFIIAIVFVAVVAGGIVGFNMFRDRMIADFFANMPATAYPVSTVSVTSGDWQPGIEAIGTVYAARGIDLAVEAGGVIRSVAFSANEEVEEGQLLVQIDDAIEQADLVAARSQVEVSNAALERARTLSDRGVSSAVNVQEADAAAASALAQIERLNAVLGQKSLEAPFSGTIGIPRVEAGQFVSAGTTVATLQDLDTLRVDFTVPEQQLARISAGQTVAIAAEAGGSVASGTITGIEPRIDPQTRLVSLRAEVDNQDGRLNPGQFVRVRIQLPVEDNIVALPQTAVTTSLYGDFIYVVTEPEEPIATAEGEPERFVVRQVFVQTGRRYGDQVEVTEGVSAGDRVVTAGQNRLSNGSQVTLTPSGDENQPEQSTEAASAEGDAQ